MKKIITPLCLLFALTVHAQPSGMDIFVSTGDNHFLGSSLPIDSPASIEATFDLFKNVNYARRVYWRGLEEATWISTMHARPENPRYYSLWTWMQDLYANVHPDELAVKAAHARGMEIWGVGTMWDWGSPADTPTFGDYPFPFESKLKLEHPEWAAVDKHGVRRQGGPIELAYPEARKALVDLHLRETLKAGYDGITFLTYAENYSMRFQDEFGYSDPIVEDFKKLHRVDLRKEGFKRGASREDWLRLRGSYITAYLRELHTALAAHGKKLGVIINGNDAHSPLTWNVLELMKTAGSQYMDVEAWVKEGLVENLTVYGNCARNAQLKTVEDLLFLCRQTGVEVNFMSSSPLDPGWQGVNGKGATCVLAVSDDAQHLARGFVPEQTTESLKSEDLWLRLRALGQIADGHLAAKVEEMAPLVRSNNLIERRMALRALGLSKSPGALALIEPALADEENGVRCSAALALGDLRDVHALHPLIESLEKHGNHMLVECVIIALRRLQPTPLDELAEVVKTSPDATLRMAAMRALIPFATLAQMPVIRKAMDDKDRFTAYAATEAMANIRKTNGNMFPLIEQLTNHDTALAARAAVSLGVLGASSEPGLISHRQDMLAALTEDFERFSTGCTRADADWGWRPVGNAIRAFGEAGEAVLRKLRDQRLDLKLAELAWRALDLHQQPNTFSEVDERQNEEAVSHRPRPDDDLAKKPLAFPKGRDLHVDPKTGDDKNDGIAKPVKTIAKAVKMALPGDTVHLASARYYESVDLTLKHGELGRPITVDGHGAVLDGSEPVTSNEWEAAGDGLFKKQHLIKRIDDAIIMRFFFVWDGRMNHMGRTSKGTKAPFKKPADLKPGEWTYTAEDDTFYVRIEPGQSLEAAKIRYPMRSSGVVESISGSHLVVRNTISTHVYNDGYNIHGMTRDCRFENIAAIDCGDDGFSAHDDCECFTDGFVSIGNSTGVTDTVDSVTRFKNVYIKGNLGYDVFFVGENEHSIENGVVESSAERGLSIGLSGTRNFPGAKCPVQLKNVFFIRSGGKEPEGHVSRGGELKADQCSFIHLPLRPAPGAAMELNGCVVGEAKPGEGEGADEASLQSLKTKAEAIVKHWQELEN